MLRRTLGRLQSEFESKKWSDLFPRPAQYGEGYCFRAKKGTRQIGRSRWAQSLRFRTVASNRLLGRARYQHLIDEIDTAKMESADINLPLTDLRWNDNRVVHFVCRHCKAPYTHRLAARVKYHAGCPRCSDSKVFPSPTLGAQSARVPLPPAPVPAGRGKGAPAAAAVAPTPRVVCAPGDTLGARFPKLAEELAEENNEFVRSLHPASPFRAKWKCCECKEETFTASIRQRTGASIDGGVCFDPSLAAACPQCTWLKRMNGVALRFKQKGGTNSLLGLD